MSQTQKVGWESGAACHKKAKKDTKCVSPIKKYGSEALAVYTIFFVHFLVAAAVPASPLSGFLVAIAQGLVVYHAASLYFRSGPIANVWMTVLSSLCKVAASIEGPPLAAAASE